MLGFLGANKSTRLQKESQNRLPSPVPDSF
jgi:hypothetical protein